MSHNPCAGIIRIRFNRSESFLHSLSACRGKLPLFPYSIYSSALLCGPGTSDVHGIIIPRFFQIARKTCYLPDGLKIRGSMLA